MPEIGKMRKGDTIPHAARQADEAGVPHRAPQSAPAPRGEQHQKEAHTTVGRNTGRVR
jgi:hypothetical protein